MNNGWCVDAIVDDNGVYGILDDIPWTELKHYGYKALLGAQEGVTFTGKFRNQKQFDWGYPVIVTSNEIPDFSEEEKAWLRENVDFYLITYNLFQLNDNIPEWDKINI